MQGHALRERYLQDDTQILMTMIRMVLQRDRPRFLGFPLTLKSVMMKKMNKARRLERPLVLLSKIFFLSIVGIDCIALSEITERLLNEVAREGNLWVWPQQKVSSKEINEVREFDAMSMLTLYRKGFCSNSVLLIRR